jgi:transcriptional regulator NrdR family protein
MAMDCAICGGRTSVVRTIVSDQFRVRRQRRCELDHRIETIETRAVVSLEKVLVRRSDPIGSGPLEPFTRGALLSDVRAAVLKRLTDEQSALLVADVQRSLEFRLPELGLPLTTQEASEHEGFTLCVPGRAISETVDWHLRISEYPLAHVLFAMSHLGALGKGPGQGWDSAKDVLEWLTARENYGHLALDIPQQARAAVDAWNSPGRPERPNSVVKRSRRVADFQHKKFYRSVLRALLGRPDKEHMAEAVSDWVLWGLTGQRQVTTAQLGVGVLDCLRRLDDVAYLRWATIAKNIEDVEEFRDEALALLTHPSPKLVLDVSLKRPVPPDRRVQNPFRAEP